MLGYRLKTNEVQNPSPHLKLDLHGVGGWLHHFPPCFLRTSLGLIPLGEHKESSFYAFPLHYDWTWAAKCVITRRSPCYPIRPLVFGPAPRVLLAENARARDVGCRVTECTLSTAAIWAHRHHHPWGPYIKDVRIIIGILDPLPPCPQIHSTSLTEL